jgi:hypothetical protein
MYMLWDEDEWELVIELRPCAACGGNLRKCNGMCNGMLSVGHKRRDPADVKHIKVERELKREDAILQEAEFIVAKRRRDEPEGKSLDEMEPLLT